MYRLITIIRDNSRDPLGAILKQVGDSRASDRGDGVEDDVCLAAGRAPVGFDGIASRGDVTPFGDVGAVRVERLA